MARAPHVADRGVRLELGSSQASIHDCTQPWDHPPGFISGVPPIGLSAPCDMPCYSYCAHARGTLIGACNLMGPVLVFRDHPDNDWDLDRHHHRHHHQLVECHDH